MRVTHPPHYRPGIRQEEQTRQRRQARPQAGAGPSLPLRAIPEHEPVAMLWSPVMRNQRPESKYNQIQDVLTIQQNVHKSTGVAVEAIINERYQQILLDLREV